MSLRLFIILEKNINTNILSKIRSEYKLSLIKIKNDTLHPFLKADEEAYQVTEDGIDTDTGIGTLEILKNIKLVKSILKNNESGSQELTARMTRYKEVLQDKDQKSKIIELINERLSAYKNDLKKWKKIILGLNNKFKLNIIGLLYVNADSMSDNYNFNNIVRENAIKGKISIKQLILLKDNTILIYK
jgi:hypothetical protein